MQPTKDIKCLSAFLFFDDDFKMKLKSELPTYLSKCADTNESFCPLQWWKKNALELPYRAEATNKTILL